MNDSEKQIIAPTSPLTSNVNTGYETACEATSPILKSPKLLIEEKVGGMIRFKRVPAKKRNPRFRIRLAWQ